MTGRPSIYTEELALEICTRIAEGESLRSVCRDEDMPATSTVMKWVLENHIFSEQYERAREAQADSLFDELVDIADEATPDNVQVQRLRVDTRKWAASKLKSKRYGDKLQVGGAADLPPIQTRNTLDVSALTLEQLDALQAALTTTLSKTDGE